MWLPLLFCLSLSVLLPQPSGLPAQSSPGGDSLEKSAYFAFVDRDFIFTLEMVGAGVPIVNFVSMVDTENQLQAKYIRLALENRKEPAKFFLVDTGNPKEPIILPSIRIRPRSSFGMRIQGDFGDVREVWGVTVGVGMEDFKLVPLTGFDFEKLAIKINGINLGSPDFRDDWRVLKLDTMGSRERVRRRR